MVVFIAPATAFLLLHHFKAPATPACSGPRFLQLLGATDLLIAPRAPSSSESSLQAPTDFRYSAAAPVFQLAPFLPQQGCCLGQRPLLPCPP